MSAPQAPGLSSGHGVLPIRTVILRVSVDLEVLAVLNSVRDRFMDPDVIPPFHALSGILRVASQYKASKFRKLMVRCLETGYVTSFERTGGQSVLGNEIFPEPIPHPNAVLKICIECDVQQCLAFAYWDACFAGMESILSSHPDELLPPSTVKTTVMGNMALMVFQAKRVKSTFSCFAPDCKCSAKVRLPETLEAQRSLAFPLDNPNIRASEFGSLLAEDLVADFCKRCRKLWAQKDEKSRAELWDNLPGYFGLPPWGELVAHGTKESRRLLHIVRHMIDAFQDQGVLFQPMLLPPLLVLLGPQHWI